MLSKSDLNTIKTIANEFFQKMTFDVSLEFLPQNEKTLPIKVRTEEPKILIGEAGQTLADIQRLLKSISKKRIEEDFYIDLDINDYKSKKKEYLRELACSSADEVALNREEKILHPMSSYERRIIHMELAGRQDVTTESIGQEPERRVVIRSYP